MKKFIIMVLVFGFTISANAYDIGTYPREAEMKNVVYHWFMDYAINVDTSGTSTDTPERIAFAIAVVSGAVNYNTMSVACATNAAIRAKIIADDDSYKDDLEFVISTEYEFGGGIPLFTILAGKIYGQE